MSASQFLENLRNQIEFDDNSIEVIEHANDFFTINIAKNITEPIEYRRIRAKFSRSTWDDPLSVIRMRFSRILNVKGKTFKTTQSSDYTFDPHDYWLNKLYVVEEKFSDEESLHKVIHLTDKLYNIEHIVCMKYSDTYMGWFSANPNDQKFIGILTMITPVYELSVKLLRGRIMSEPTLDVKTGEIVISDYFSYRHAIMQSMEVITDTSTLVVIDYLSLNFRKTKEYSSARFTFRLSDGKVSVNKEFIHPPEWLSRTYEQYDLVKHPNNTFMHHILPSEVDPLFEGKYLYITYNKLCFVEFDNSWILADQTWLKNRIGDYPKLQHDWLAAKMLDVLP